MMIERSIIREVKRSGTLSFGRWTLVCQTSEAALLGAKLIDPVARDSRGRLERSHAGSRVLIGIPPSPAKLSSHAWPMLFGCGRLVAISACSMTRDSPGRSLSSGSLASALLRSGASQLQFPVTPATSDDAGSKPNGGRVYCDFCPWLIAVKVTSPDGALKVVASPKMFVAALVKRGFSSYCTVTVRGRGKSVSGRAKVTRPSS